MVDKVEFQPTGFAPLEAQPIQKDQLVVSPGRALPLGSSVRQDGVRFAVVSRHATRVWLCLFNSQEDETPAVELEFDATRHKVGDVWSMYVRGLRHGTLYAYRMDGPFEPERGHRYDPEAYLLDPYATCLTGDISHGKGKGVVVSHDLDWFADVRPSVPMSETIIYETHVRGLTVHPSAGVQNGGTYRGLIEKLPYLKDLGVTSIELLPIHQAGEDELDRVNPETGEVLRNYWGYSTIGFFAPSERYATICAQCEQIEEFRELVTAAHKSGMEIIIDVVFNHTSEGNEKGRTLSFRGIDNAIYYWLDDNGDYLNYSGCGNTIDSNHPLVRDFILDCLRYWVTIYHVDGFRFDLAAIFGRNREGNVISNAPLVERIAEDPVLRDVKLIAEAWDAAGAYQVGSFGDVRWAEWNGHFRDHVRRFWHGDYGMVGAFATRLAGSADLYQGAGRNPTHSINFVTSHDGFTLRDLVSYERKHNEMNGEGNQDGENCNFSWNFGVEGDTDDLVVNEARLRTQKSMLATLFLSLGVPMLLGGDEFGRTQRGNNNAYCQDNEISWYDWRLLERYKGLHHFCKEIIRFRKQNPVFRRQTFFNGVGPDEDQDVQWFSLEGTPPAWNEGPPCLGWFINGTFNGGEALYLMFNGNGDTQTFLLPKGPWHVAIDTSQPSPNDIHEKDRPALGHKHTMEVVSKGLIVLTCKQSKLTMPLEHRGKRHGEEEAAHLGEASEA
jgi:glycogen operon protein